MKQYILALDLIHGFTQEKSDHPSAFHGTDLQLINASILDNPGFATLIHLLLPYNKAMVVFACLNEMAQTANDVLSRRTKGALPEYRGCK